MICKYLKRTERVLCEKPKEVRYEFDIDESDEKYILEAIFSFQRYEAILGQSRWDFEDKLKSSAYLRGVADTLPNGEELHEIADMLDAIKSLFRVSVTRKEIKE